jgi:hypothetical protein
MKRLTSVLSMLLIVFAIGCSSSPEEAYFQKETGLILGSEMWMHKAYLVRSGGEPGIVTYKYRTGRVITRDFMSWMGALGR